MSRAREAPLSPESFAWLAAFLKAESGLVLSEASHYLPAQRLSEIAREQGCAGLEALVARLRGGRHAALASRVVEAMTTNESSFFRDARPFAHFRETLARLGAARPPGVPLRIWSAACSTGQEAYSLAMLVAEAKAALAGRAVEILGTDLSRAALARARQGLYSRFEVERGLPPSLLARHFRKEGAGFRVSGALRAMVCWRRHNLLERLAPAGRFDVVFCRNVLLYFDPPTREGVLERIAATLPADGLLYLGGAETLRGVSQRFEPLAGLRGVYAPVFCASAQPPAVGAAAARPRARPSPSPPAGAGAAATGRGPARPGIGGGKAAAAAGSRST